MLREDNFLLLDEPTNHLDIPSREALEDSLMDYDGTLFVISHDRYFLNKVIDRIYELKADSMKEYLGNYSYYAEKRELPEKAPQEKTTDTSSELERVRRKVSQRDERKARVRLREVEDEVEIEEAHLEELTASLADYEVYIDPQRMKKVNAEIHASQAKLQNLMTEWEDLLAITEDS